MVNVEINKGSIVAIIILLVGLAISYFYEKEISIVGTIIAIIATTILVKNHYEHRR
jgi:1,4-dihydroxy-2-naphthoate octaprenyltransferase